MLLLFALRSWCRTRGFTKCHRLSWTELLTFRQGLGFGTPEPWAMLPGCPRSLQRAPDFTGSFSGVIFAAWETLRLSEGEGRKQLQLSFPIFHSGR